MNTTNARSRGKECLVYFPFPKQKKTLNVPLHTNPNNFTPNFKPHTISPWDILKLKKPSKLPTSCRPKSLHGDDASTKQNEHLQPLQACLHQTLVCAFHRLSKTTSHSLWIWTFIEIHIHETQNEHSLAKFAKMGKPWNMKNITRIYDCIIYTINLEFTCVIVLTLIYPPPNMHGSNLVLWIKNPC